MRGKFDSRPWWPVLAFFSIAVVATTARAEDSPPHGVDLVQYGGNAKTVVIQMLNLTPYDISYVSSDLKDSTDRTEDKCNSKKMMFAPVGIPGSIPKVPPEAFNNPNFRNTSTHLYSGVVSWCDCGDSGSGTSLINWQVKGVNYSYLDANNVVHTGTGNPTVQLAITRDPPNKDLKAGFFMVVKDITKLGLAVAGLVVEGENPLAWIEAILAIKETAQGAAEFAKENTRNDNGKKMWLAAYAWPEEGSCKGRVDQNCSPGRSAVDDAVDTQWGSTQAGYAAAEIVVTMQLLRGSTYTLGVGSEASVYGNLPIVQLIVWDSATYWAAYNDVQGTPLAATQHGQKMRSLLKPRGRAGLLGLRNLIHSMDAKQKETLIKSYRDLQARHPLGNPEKAVQAELELAFEKNAKTMHPEIPERGGQTHVH